MLKKDNNYYIILALGSGMMYCSNCGEKIIENNTFCTSCGNRYHIVVDKKDSGKKIASIVLGCIGTFLALQFVFAPISLILTIIGLIIGIIASKRENNTLGIIVNVIGLILSILCICVFMLIIIIFRYDGYNDDYYNDMYGVNEQNREYY